MSTLWLSFTLALAACGQKEDVGTWLRKGQMLAARGEHAKAIAALDQVLKIDPKNVRALSERGGEHFKLGQIKESVRDFDREISLQPKAFPSHWRRGISLYYVGRFTDGMKQFQGYEKVDTNDVENAVWHFLCAARKHGVKKARAGILKIGRDRRIPMMKVYELYKGDAKPADVLKVITNAKPSSAQKSHALFYAHLYLGLYYEAVEKSTKKALPHLEKAAGEYRIDHYMGDVARVHRDLLKK